MITLSAELIIAKALVLVGIALYFASSISVIYGVYRITQYLKRDNVIRSYTGVFRR